MICIRLLLCCFGLLLPHAASARWAKLEEAPIVRTKDRVEWFVKEDGSFFLTRETEDEVRLEAGRQDAGLMQIFYNPTSERAKILTATVIQNGKEQAVAPEFIQDKALASTGSGFDPAHQIVIAFPGVEVGTKVRVKYTLELFHPPYRGFFSQTFTAPMGRAQSALQTMIYSEKPLHVRAADPEKFAQVKSNSKGNRRGPDNKLYPYEIEVRLQKPLYKVIVDETDPLMNSKSLPWVDIASSTDWRDLVRPLVPEYEKVISAPLPPFLQSIARKAKRKTSSEDILNEAHAELASRMRYLGDWRPVNGGHVPRSLETIAKTKFGDCKDFSAALVAILRSLGFQAHVAIIYRGRNPLFSPTNLPSQMEFNHAIVWVQDAQGKEFWLDGTNPFAFAQGIPADIADRRAMILAEPPLEKRTPALLPQDSTYHAKLKSTLEKDRRLQARVEATYGGFMATEIVGAALALPPESIVYEFLRDEADLKRLVDWNLDPVDLSSRIVGDIKVAYRFREDEVQIPTSAGPAVFLPKPWILSRLTHSTHGRVSDLPLVRPQIADREFLIHGLRVIGDRNMSCTIRSPWLDLNRTFSRLAKGFTLRDEMTLKTAVIPNSDLHSAEFQKLQNALRDCVDSAAVVYEALP